MEWYTRYIFQMIEKMQMENIKSFEVKEDAVRDLYDHTHELMKRLVWSSRKCLSSQFFAAPSDATILLIYLIACRSWFKNGKIHGPVTAIYPGSRLHFFEMLKNVRWEDYKLEYKGANRFQFMGNGFTHCESSVEGDPVWYFDDPFVLV